MPTPFIIAIDGTSGAGKSSAARALAGKLNCLYVDTGTHYRAVTVGLQRAKVPYTAPEAVERELSHWTLDEEIVDGEARILLNHKGFNAGELRSATVNMEVPYYSALPIVRKFLLHFQHAQLEVAQMNDFAGLVMEGRDIGLNIFPHTPLKYFFIANAKIKAARRAGEGLLDVTDERDFVDSTHGQLRKAVDAVQVDTSQSSVAEVVAWLVKDVSGKLGRGA